MQDRLNFNYNTSKDYEKLFELVKTQRVVCFVTYEETIGGNSNNKITLTDICASSAFKSNSDVVNLGVRGTGYVTAMEFDGKTVKEDFIRQCEHYKLEYIEPNIVDKT